jgi:Glutaredoxin-like domain (DUF836)
VLVSRPTADPQTPARVVLFSRPGCHLCADARAVVDEVCTAAGERWQEIDISSGPDAAGLTERYGEFVPVVEVDGVQQGFWRVDGARLARRLARTRG